MRRWLRRYPQTLAFLMFLPVGGMYFLSQWMGLEHRVIHLPLDDRIPFVPAFIVPYILWYLYVPGMLLTTCFRDRGAFRRQAWTLFSGMLLSTAFFLIWPTCIDFRPDAAGPGLLRWLCRFIYAHDRPVNVLPSLHCYEALAVHLGAFGAGRGSKMPVRRALSAALVTLICLSTVFVKQHSVVDLAAGCGLAAGIYALVRAFERRKQSRRALRGEHS